LLCKLAITLSQTAREGRDGFMNRGGLGYKKNKDVKTVLRVLRIEKV